MGDPARGTLQRGQGLGDPLVPAGPLVRRQLLDQALPHERVPEAEPALGGLDHQGGQRQLELAVGLVLGAVG